MISMISNDILSKWCIIYVVSIESRNCECKVYRDVRVSCSCPSRIQKDHMY